MHLVTDATARTDLGTPQATTLHPDDAVSLAALVAAGRGGAVHRWTHHLFLDDAESSRGAAERLRATGWQVSVVAALPAPFPGWQVRVHRDTVVGAEALTAARAELNEVADHHHGSYAGWDAHPVPRYSVPA